MSSGEKKARLYYHRLPEFDRKENKLDFLSDNSLSTVDWQRLIPNQKHTWRRTDTEDEFDSFLPIGSKEAKRAKSDQAETIFKTYSRGVATSRDSFAYDFVPGSLATRMKILAENYNTQVDKYQRMNPKPEIDDFVDYENVAWSRDLKLDLKRGNYAVFSHTKLRASIYRPFAKKHLFFDRILNEEVYQQPAYFPDVHSESENVLLGVGSVGIEKPFYSIAINCIPNLSFVGFGGACQCFPFYTYHEDGSNRRENITDYALDQFRRHYSDPAISKWDIFYYVYGILHHPGYRERYALDLKRNLPRIPFAPAFRPYADAGETLADLHLNYESADRYPLDWASTRKPVSYRVEKMLPKGKVDSAEGSYKVYHTLKYNDTLTLQGIPERAFAYRLGNRSALDWIVDQYRVKTDKRSGITHDPNGYSNDPQYILKLIERVITVSLRTVDVVEGLSTLPFREE